MPGAWDIPKAAFLWKPAVNEPAAPEKPQVTATAIPAEKPEVIRKAAGTPTPEKPEVGRSVAATPTRTPEKAAAEGTRPGQAPPEQLGQLQIRRGAPF